MVAMKSFIVLGLGRFGKAVATSLYANGNEVLAVDINEEVINEIQNYVTHAIIGDCKDEAVLKAIGVRNFDVAIVSVGEDLHTSILTTVLLKEQGVNYIVARAADDLHARILKKVGADRIVQPEKDMGEKFAQSLASQNILDMIDLSDNFSIVETTPISSWVGKSLKDLNLRSAYGVTVVAAKNNGGLVISPGAEYKVSPTDVLVVVGNNKSIERIRE